MIIQSSRIQLTSFTERHLQDAYVSWLNDPFLMRYSEQRLREHTLESCYQYMKSFDGTPNYFWAIEEINNGSHVGNLNVFVDTLNRTADMGILIGVRAASSRGLGTEAWMAACDYLFRHCNIRKVTAGTLGINQGMIKVCEKSGMQPDGRRSRQVMLGNQEVDLVYYAIFRQPWLDKYTKPPALAIP